MVYSMSIQFSKMSIRHRVIYLQVVLLFRYIRILRLVHYLFYHTKRISLFLSTPIYRVYNLSLKTVIYIYIYIYNIICNKYHRNVSLALKKGRRRGKKRRRRTFARNVRTLLCGIFRQYTLSHF